MGLFHDAVERMAARDGIPASRDRQHNQDAEIVILAHGGGRVVCAASGLELAKNTPEGVRDLARVRYERALIVLSSGAA